MTTVGERVGPVFSRAQMVEAGLAVDELISFRLRGTEEVYPAAQFDVAEGRLHLRADVADLWRELGELGLGRLGCWMWLTGRREALGGFTPIEYLSRRGLDAHLATELRALVPAAVAA